MKSPVVELQHCEAFYKTRNPGVTLPGSAGLVINAARIAEEAADRFEL